MEGDGERLEFLDADVHTPSIAFRHLPPKEGCHKPVLGVWLTSWQPLTVTKDGGIKIVVKGER